MTHLTKRMEIARRRDKVEGLRWKRYTYAEIAAELGIRESMVADDMEYIKADRKRRGLLPPPGRQPGRTTDKF